jgi:protein transport protein SEC13
VNSICWAPHELGLCLATASSDSKISILTHRNDNSWNVEQFVAHNIGVNAVSWAPAIQPGSFLQHGSKQLVKRLVSGGCDNLVKIWTYVFLSLELFTIFIDRFDNDKNLWQSTTCEGGHSDWVRDVAWAPSIGMPGSLIASCSQDRSVIIWNEDNGWKKKASIQLNEVGWRVSWSILGNILAVSTGDNKVSLYKESLQENTWKCISSLDESSEQ